MYKNIKQPNSGINFDISSKKGINLLIKFIQSAGAALMSPEDKAEFVINLFIENLTLEEINQRAIETIGTNIANTIMSKDLLNQLALILYRNGKSREKVIEIFKEVSGKSQRAIAIRQLAKYKREKTAQEKEEEKKEDEHEEELVTCIICQDNYRQIDIVPLQGLNICLCCFGGKDTSISPCIGDGYMGNLINSTTLGDGEYTLVKENWEKYPTHAPRLPIPSELAPVIGALRDTPNEDSYSREFLGENITLRNLEKLDEAHLTWRENSSDRTKRVWTRIANRIREGNLTRNPVEIGVDEALEYIINEIFSFRCTSCGHLFVDMIALLNLNRNPLINQFYSRKKEILPPDYMFLSDLSDINCGAILCPVVNCPSKSGGEEFIDPETGQVLNFAASSPISALTWINTGGDAHHHFNTGKCPYSQKRFNKNYIAIWLEQISIKTNLYLKKVKSQQTKNEWDGFLDHIKQALVVIRETINMSLKALDHIYRSDIDIHFDWDIISKLTFLSKLSKDKITKKSFKNAMEEAKLYNKQLRSSVMKVEQEEDDLAEHWEGNAKQGGGKFVNLYLNIINPKTNRKVNINSRLGKKILKNYIINL
jgi:hypothetical protein